MSALATVTALTAAFERRPKKTETERTAERAHAAHRSLINEDGFVRTNVCRDAVARISLAHAVYSVPSHQTPEHRLLPVDGRGWFQADGRFWAMNIHACEFSYHFDYVPEKHQCSRCECSLVLSIGHDQSRHPGEALAFELSHDGVTWRVEPVAL